MDDLEVETLIDARVNALIQQHLSTASNSATGGVRSRIAVQFFEKRRKKSGAWFTGLTGSGEEEVCWEIWTLDITIATPRTELGMLPDSLLWLYSSAALIGKYRPSKGAKGDGENVEESRAQDRGHCE